MAFRSGGRHIRRPALALRDCARGMTSVQRSKFDAVIIGGGVVGLSSAYHLALKLGAGEGICVLERDNTYARCSATLSAGGIRQQFSGAQNSAMSQYGYKFLSNTEALRSSPTAEPVDFQFCEGGYLFLASESGRATLDENHRTQTEAGHAGVLLLDPPAISARFPWLSMDGVSAGSLGVKHEGWFDPWALISALRAKCKAMGVTVHDGEATSLGVRTASPGGKRHIDSVRTKDGVEFTARTVVNAAGAFAADVVGMALGAQAGASFEVRCGIPRGMVYPRRHGCGRARPSRGPADRSALAPLKAWPNHPLPCRRCDRAGAASSTSIVRTRPFATRRWWSIQAASGSVARGTVAAS